MGGTRQLKELNRFSVLRGKSNGNPALSAINIIAPDLPPSDLPPSLGWAWGRGAVDWGGGRKTLRLDPHTHPTPRRVFRKVSNPRFGAPARRHPLPPLR